MKLIENYRPAQIEFDVYAMDVPNDLGAFKTAEEAQSFINENMIAVPQKLETYRLMDEYEKDVIRDRYRLELEDVLPEYQNELAIANIDLATAKDAEQRAKENVKIQP